MSTSLPAVIAPRPFATELTFMPKPGATNVYYLDPVKIVTRAKELGALTLEWDAAHGVHIAKIAHMSGHSAVVSPGVDGEFFTAIVKAIKEAERLR